MAMRGRGAPRVQITVKDVSRVTWDGRLGQGGRAVLPTACTAPGKDISSRGQCGPRALTGSVDLEVSAGTKAALHILCAIGLDRFCEVVERVRERSNNYLPCGVFE